MDQIATGQLRPWEQPIWKPAKGQTRVLLYLLLIHLLALTGLILYPIPSLPVLGVAILLACLGGVGTTVCYHRTMAHRSVKLNKAVEHFLIFGAMFNGSGSPRSWVANHRHHHSHSDQPDDISSPRQGGFWWAHMRWLYQSSLPDEKKWAPEMTTPEYNFWSHAQMFIVLLSLTCGLVHSWEAFFWVGAIRMVYTLHVQCLANSLTHLGYDQEGDASINLWWLGPFQLTAWGENWHRNHHHRAGSAQFGWRWYQIDLGWYAIWFLESLGLASSVRRLKSS